MKKLIFILLIFTSFLVKGQEGAEYLHAIAWETNVGNVISTP
jgi:hypothetical protein